MSALKRHQHWLKTGCSHHVTPFSHLAMPIGVDHDQRRKLLQDAMVASMTAAALIRAWRRPDGTWKWQPPKPIAANAA